MSDPLQDAIEALGEALRTRCGDEIAAVVTALAAAGRFCQPMVAEADGARVRVEVWRTGSKAWRAGEKPR